MNEEQLKEIAILAKELGFKPRTLSTGVTFEKFTRVDKGLPLNDTCYYLLLCEIQLWLNEKWNCLLEIIFQRSKKYTNNKIVYFVTVDYYGKEFEKELTNEADFSSGVCDSTKDALATGILESLKKKKNGN